jgi:hypothetical protein
VWLRVRNKAPRKGSNKFVSNAKENGLVEESKNCVSWKKNSGEIPPRKMDKESPRL